MNPTERAEAVRSLRAAKPRDLSPPTAEEVREWPHWAMRSPGGDVEVVTLRTLFGASVAGDRVSVAGEDGKPHAWALRYQWAPVRVEWPK